MAAHAFELRIIRIRVFLDKFRIDVQEHLQAVAELLGGSGWAFAHAQQLGGAGVAADIGDPVRNPQTLMRGLPCLVEIVGVAEMVAIGIQEQESASKPAWQFVDVRPYPGRHIDAAKMIGLCAVTQPAARDHLFHQQVRPVPAIPPQRQCLARTQTAAEQDGEIGFVMAFEFSYQLIPLFWPVAMDGGLLVFFWPDAVGRRWVYTGVVEYATQGNQSVAFGLSGYRMAGQNFFDLRGGNLADQAFGKRRYPIAIQCAQILHAGGVFHIQRVQILLSRLSKRLESFMGRLNLAQGKAKL